MNACPPYLHSKSCADEACAVCTRRDMPIATFVTAMGWLAAPCPCAAPAGSGWRRRRLLQRTEIRLAGVPEHGGAGGVAHAEHGAEISSGRLDRLLDHDTDGGAPREPLVAAQHRAHAAQDAGHDRQIGFGRDLERAHVEPEQPGAARERAFGE